MADQATTSTPAVETPAMTAGKPGETKTTATTVADTSSTPKTPPASSIMDFVPTFAAMLIFGWIFFIRPEKKRREAQLALMSAMKEGDKVVLISGIYGTIAKMDGDEVTIVIDPKTNTRMRVRKDAIANTLTDEEKKK